MGLPELRSELHDFINLADELFLKLVYAMSKEYEKSTTVGYDTNGLPITQHNLIARVKSASMRVKSGDFITQEEIEKEIENW